MAEKEVVKKTVAPAVPSRSKSDITLVLRREMKVGNRDMEIGDIIANLKLEPDVPLSFLGDALRHGFISQQ